jgi:hypothetical protein
MVIGIIIIGVFILSVLGGTSSDRVETSVIDLPTGYVPPPEVIRPFAAVDETGVTPAPFTPESVFLSETASQVEDIFIRPRQSESVRSYY